jgi:hypothetical protein
MAKLDRRFRAWLKQIGVKWGVPADFVAGGIGSTEIKNRFSIYPSVQRLLETKPVPWNSVFSLLRSCWALGGRFDAIRLNKFIEWGDKSIAAVVELLRSASDPSAKSIDRFIESAVKLGYVNSNRGTADRPGAALLASVLLTCANPTRFVDYRRSRWKHFANALGYPLPQSSASERNWILWAGEFARQVTQTKTYEALWGDEPRLWTLAGVCWDARDPQPPVPVVPDPPDPAEEGAYAEGEAKRRLHLIRERSALVVRRAKDLREKTDPWLHCESCGLSYRDVYGDRGSGFIEAHHRIPLAQLRSGIPTRVEDLVLLCANCHRMIHRNPTLTIEELRKLVRGNGQESIG